MRNPIIRDALHVRVSEKEQERQIAAGEVRPEDCAPSLKIEKADNPNEKFFDVMLRLEDRPTIREALEAYCAGPWAVWAEIEKPRRRSIVVYQRLFEIAQRLLQSGGSESIEITANAARAAATKAIDPAKRFNALCPPAPPLFKCVTATTAMRSRSAISARGSRRRW